MQRAAKTPARRMGPAGSATWNAILDGAEEILREEGYAALSSRAIADRVGIKQRLVYYYFHTMDDLIIETFERLSVRELARLRQAVDAPGPLREIWNICVHTTDVRLISEFMALANRIEGLRAVVIHFIEQSRALQVEALQAALARKTTRKTTGTKIPPVAWALLATSVALSLTREEKLGVAAGHREMTGLIEAFIAELEPQAEARPAPGARKQAPKRTRVK